MATAEPLEIVLYPDPFLTKKARAITPDEIKAGQAGEWSLAELIERMKATMYAAEGIGLAAPQVGVGLRLFLADISKDRSGVQAILNPALTELRGSVIEEEGCLSIPGVRAKVKRSAELKLKGVDPQGKPIEIEATDLLSRVFQHEYDHLDGVLFINRIGMTARLMMRKRLVELEEDYELKKKKVKAQAAR